ncbi:MAG: hypothetical protein ACI8PZ_005777 [Myxococcota bacterium]|jgi:hypothetical protein
MWRGFLLLALHACATEAPERGHSAAPAAPEAATAPEPPTIPPPEVCDGVDNDGDGLVDADDPSVDRSTGVALYVDADGDGFGDPDHPTWACAADDGHVADGSDCDDADAEVFPGAVSRCDGRPDTDCDGLPDDSESDADADGWSRCAGDCDDANPAVYPDAPELCDDVDNDCDGRVDLDDPGWDRSACGWCPDADGFDVERIVAETWNPCLLDPRAVRYCTHDPDRPEVHNAGTYLHRVWWRDDHEFRDELFLYMPPGIGTQTQRIPTLAAWAGYRTISLAHVNDVTLRTACGRHHTDPAACYGWALEEMVYGVDTSDVIRAPAADGAVRRLGALLAHLHAEHPDQGWDSYLGPNGAILWHKIVVGGWSVGASTAAYIAGREAVDGAVLMGGPQDWFLADEVAPALADWTYWPRATPGCTHFGLLHTEDVNLGLPASWSLFGMLPQAADADVERPPYGDRQRLRTSVIDGIGCSGHETLGEDRCMRPELTEAYMYLLCEAARWDADACPP